MQQRYMDPALGRFMSNDPIDFRDVHSFNRYVYANNNPYKYVDPDGRIASIAFPVLGKTINQSIKLAEAQKNGTIGAGTIAGAITTSVAATVVVSKTMAKTISSKVVRETRKDGKAVEITFKNGNKKDISVKRVKESKPATHAKAPPGSMQKVKFKNALPHTKGLKRAPTPKELKLLEKLTT